MGEDAYQDFGAYSMKNSLGAGSTLCNDMAQLANEKDQPMNLRTIPYNIPSTDQICIFLLLCNCICQVERCNQAHDSIEMIYFMEPQISGWY